MFTGKKVLVTGGRRGIGSATVLKFAAAGAHVTLTYRSGQDEAEATALEAGATAIHADFQGLADVQSCLAQVGEVDILVNNAAIWEPEAFLPVDGGQALS